MEPVIVKSTWSDIRITTAGCLGVAADAGVVLFLLVSLLPTLNAEHAAALAGTTVQVAVARLCHGVEHWRRATTLAPIALLPMWELADPCHGLAGGPECVAGRYLFCAFAGSLAWTAVFGSSGLRMLAAANALVAAIVAFTPRVY
ncbi:MAG: hypothetical protein AAF790_15570 [Planctomycetota bacterium]